jgi:hypothetical protein
MGSLKTSSFGACDIAKYSPKRETLTANTKVLNIRISFEEALKLNLALDECVRKLNKYKRSSKEGKRAAVNLVLHLSKDRVAVVEGLI